MIEGGRRSRPPRQCAVVAVLACLVLLPAWSAAPASAQSLEGRVREVSLANGMRFLLVRRGTAPVFTGMLRFRVGSADDRTGETGLAHLFEHLAFKGTSTIGVRDRAKEKEVLDALDATVRDLLRETDRGAAADPARLADLRARMKSLQDQEHGLVVKDEFSDILSRNGGVGLNASTSSDMTSYYVSLPANRLELWCLMESARLRDPVLREFYSERDVVKEERRYRLETNPQGKIYEQMLLTAFSAHPYRVPGVGWMSDLDHLTRPEAEAFRKAYYVPANGVGALVGDIDPDAAEPLLRRYFGTLPAAEPPPPPVTVEPPQTGERLVHVDFDAEPQILIAFHKPDLLDPDDPVYEVIDGLLTSGRTSRLFRRLVTEERTAAYVYAFEAPGRRFPNLFVIGSAPRAPHTAEEVETAILAELDRLGKEPVPDRELQKIRNQVTSDAVYALRSNSGLAFQLSYYETLTGDWRNLMRHDQAVRSVTAAQIQDVARRTFTEANRTVAILERPAPEAVPGSPAPAPPAKPPASGSPRSEAGR